MLTSSFIYLFLRYYFSMIVSFTAVPKCVAPGPIWANTSSPTLISTTDFAFPSTSTNRIVSAFWQIQLIVIFLLAACSTPTTTTITFTTNTETPIVGNKVGNLVPDFQLQDLEGNIVTLSDFRGSPVLINFWRIR